MKDYAQFLTGKSQSAVDAGFEPIFMPDCLFDFQADLVTWALRKGRAAIFADTGLGKTPMQLVWAENVVRKTGRPVLILTPLAVAAQTVREGAKFDIPVFHSRDGTIRQGINVTNYERLHYYSPEGLGGVVCDESSAIKAFDGKRRKEVTRFLSKIEFRLLCTATAAPNDFIELGTASEALGVMTQSDMLGEFFRSSDKARHSLFKEGDFWNRQKYFFRAHAELPFWRWVCSWARAIRKPSDLGYDDGKFVLPELIETQYVVPTTFRYDGELFVRIARTLKEQREERRRSINERCAKVAELVAKEPGASLAWCQYNPEGDLLEEIIPGAVQVAGCDSDDWKELAVEWFTGMRCICHLKRGNGWYKLAACGNQNMPRPEGPNTSLIPLNERSERVSVDRRRPTLTTCRPITPPIGINGRGHLNNVMQSTRDGGSATAMTPSIEQPRSETPKNIDFESLESGSPTSCASTASLLNATSPFLNPRAGAVPSVGGGILETPETIASTSITAMIPGSFVASCAQTAIGGSGTSETIQNVSLRQRCTCGHLSGKRVLITKPKIMSWGLNFQHCGHQIYFPSHSFEQFYQGVRRSLRFGRVGPVRIDVVATEGEAGVMANLQKKQRKADEMFARLTEEMNRAAGLVLPDRFTLPLEVPTWL